MMRICCLSCMRRIVLPVGSTARPLELLKASPCPQAGKDAFRGLSRPNRYPNPDKVLDYMRTRRDELGERVSKGIGALPEERLRLLWAVTGPFLYWDPFAFLEARGVAVPFLLVGAAPNGAYPGDLPGFPYRMDNTAFGRKLSPLEEEAMGRMNVPYHAGASLWAEAVAACSRDLKCDGVVHFMQWGATCIAGTKKEVEDRVERDEGIPVLFMEGRQMNATNEEARRQAAELEEFVEVCSAAKEERSRKALRAG